MSDDLLAPTLDESHDLRGFHKPWNPDSVVFAAFFIGPLAGGWLVAENFRRLGQKERFAPWFLGFFALGAAAIGITFWAGEVRGTEFYLEHRNMIRLGQRVATVALALVASHAQKARWRIFHMSDEQPGNVLVPALVAALVGFGATLLTATVLAQVLL